MGAWRSLSWSGHTRLGSHGILAPAPLTSTWPRGLECKPPRHSHVPASPTQTPPRDRRTEPATRPALLSSSILRPVTLICLLTKEESGADGCMGTWRDQRLSFWDPGPSDPVPLPLTLRLCAAADGLCLVPSCVCCKSLSARVLGESLAPRFQKQGLRAVLEGPPRPHGEQGVVTEVGGRALLCLLSPGPWPQACLRSCCWVLRVASKRVHASSSKVGR